MNSWSPAKNLPTAVCWTAVHEGVVALADGRALAAGGSNGTLSPVADVAVFDPDLLTWTACPPMPSPRHLHSITRLADGRVLLAGGTDRRFALPNAALRSALIFDPEHLTWTPTGDLTEPRCIHSATLLADGRVLVAGGATDRSSQSNASSATAEIYDPGSGKWTVTGSMTDARVDHTSTLLPDGRVLVAGGDLYTGRASGVSLALCELYDPRSGTWTPAGTMRDQRSAHQATVVAGGGVLVTGGGSPSSITGPVFDGHSLRTAERYDLTAGTWSQAPDLPWGRGGHRQVLLPNGKVLIAGGFDAADFVLGQLSAFVYDPLGRVWTDTGGMRTGRAWFGAALLTNGQVVVAGGMTASGTLAAPAADNLVTAESEVFA